MNNTISLGGTPDGTISRDAVHVAVVVAVADSQLYPGQHVDIGGDIATPAIDDDPFGIVDPFRIRPVNVGERFWVCVYPHHVKSMRHHWESSDPSNTPPVAGPEVMPIDEWKDYLGAVCAVLQCSEVTVLDAVYHIIETGSEIGGPQPKLATRTVDWGEFWDKYNRAHGTSVTWRSDPFCC